MPDYISFNSSLREGTPITLLADTERAIGITTAEFTMDANTVVRVMQTQTTIANGNVITSSDWSNSDESIDGNQDTRTDQLTIDGNTGTHIVDFGSDATRTVTVKVTGDGQNGQSTTRWDYELSDDNISYETAVEFLTRQYTLNNERFDTINLGSLSSFRYIRFTVRRIADSSTSKVKFAEIWEPTVSGGNSTLQFQIQNDLTSDWDTIASASAITQADSGNPTIKLTYPCRTFLQQNLEYK